MGHKRTAKKGSIVKQVQTILDAKLAIGEKKKPELSVKIDDGRRLADLKIYSWSTYHAYMKHCIDFAQWAKEKHGCRDVFEARPYVNEYLVHRMKYTSAWTTKLDASALAKLYDCRTTEFIKTPSRERKNIKRSRGSLSARRRRCEKKNEDIVRFCRATGLRRHELQALVGTQLGAKDGRFYIRNVKGKGGLVRDVPVVGTKDDIDFVIAKCQEAGANKVFTKIDKNLNIHGYRSDYACRFYTSIARKIEDIPYDKYIPSMNRYVQSGVYHCQKDLAGVKYDKVAMKLVSEALGHHRISVIAQSYLRNITR